MIHPDRWNKRCPEADECTRAELIDFLDVGAQLQEAITDWDDVRQINWTSAEG